MIDYTLWVLLTLAVGVVLVLLIELHTLLKSTMSLWIEEIDPFRAVAELVAVTLLVFLLYWVFN